MKQPLALLVIAWLASCSFPEFAVTPGEPQVPPEQPRCDDGTRNGDETGIDCGMAACARACSSGQGCSGDEDCDSERCVDGKCRAASCDDQSLNGGESDVDCGGDTTCARCAEGQVCAEPSDCDGGDCVMRRCQAISCQDGLRNGRESDLDCGGDCPPCSVGQSCGATADCDGVGCSQRACQPASCSDVIRNQDETDVDCGGSCETPCADAARCELAEDCQSGVCPKQTLRCAEPSCDDDVLNGAEPTVDCGAACPEKCAQLAACRVAADCATNGSCVKARCLPASATGAKLSTLGWVATASHTSSSTTNSPQFAIDGAQQTDWTTGTLQSQGMWFHVDMQGTQVFFSIEIDSINQPSDAANAFNVYISDDPAFPEPPVLTNYQAQKTQLAIAFPTPQVGRYLKLLLTEGGEKWWRMDEIRVKQ